MQRQYLIERLSHFFYMIFLVSKTMFNALAGQVHPKSYLLAKMHSPIYFILFLLFIYLYIYLLIYLFAYFIFVYLFIHLSIYSCLFTLLVCLFLLPSNLFLLFQFIF